MPSLDTLILLDELEREVPGLRRENEQLRETVADLRRQNEQLRETVAALLAPPPANDKERLWRETHHRAQ
jgi:hypothetical protein